MSLCAFFIQKFDTKCVKFMTCFILKDFLVSLYSKLNTFVQNFRSQEFFNLLWTFKLLFESFCINTSHQSLSYISTEANFYNIIAVSEIRPKKVLLLSLHYFPALFTFKALNQSDCLCNLWEAQWASLVSDVFIIFLEFLDRANHIKDS